MLCYKVEQGTAGNESRPFGGSRRIFVWVYLVFVSGSGGYYPPLGKVCLKYGGNMLDFEEVWKVYPRKVAKAEARKAWKQTQKIRPSNETLIKAVENQKKHLWDLTRPAFIPHFSTWLRGERWEDECEVDLGQDVLVDGEIKEWHETWTGIQNKAKELGIKEEDFDNAPQFKSAVKRAAMKAA